MLLLFYMASSSILFGQQDPQFLHPSKQSRLMYAQFACRREPTVVVPTQGFADGLRLCSAGGRFHAVPACNGQA